MRCILIILVLNLSSCWMLRAYKVRKLQLTDHKKLPSVTISKLDNPFRYFSAINNEQYKEIEASVDSLIHNTETAAFLVIRNDTLVYENYFMGFDENTILPSNSMAKSFTGTLVGIALMEGKIKSDQEPITNYLPELGKRDSRFHKITVRHLLDMRSGLDFNEGTYNLRDDAVKLGFRPNLTKHLLKAKIKEELGNFRYQSINPQLLGLIVERATQQKLQDYFQEKLWISMGTETNATWNVDNKKRKHVITSAGLNATPRDFAKIGRVYLNGGKIRDQQIINREWVEIVANSDTMEKYEGYKNQWWNRRGTKAFKDSLASIKSRRERRTILLNSDRHSYFLPDRTAAFNAFGFLEQIIYINPHKNLIIVRLGRSWPDPQKFAQAIYELGEKM